MQSRMSYSPSRRSQYIPVNSNVAYDNHTIRIFDSNTLSQYDENLKKRRNEQDVDQRTSLYDSEQKRGA